MADINVTAPDGQVYTLPDTPENRTGAAAKGYSVPLPETLLDTSVKSAPPLDTGTSPVVSAINPTKTQLPATAEALNANANQPETSAAASETDLTADGKVRVFSPDGQEYQIPNTPEDVRGAKGKGYGLISDSEIRTAGEAAKYKELSDLFKPTITPFKTGVQSATEGAAKSLVDTINKPAEAPLPATGEQFEPETVYRAPITGGENAARTVDLQGMSDQDKKSFLTTMHALPLETQYDITKAINEGKMQPGDARVAGIAIKHLHENNPIAGVIGSMLRPEQIGLMAASGGLGELAEGAAGLKGATTLAGKLAGSAVKNVVQGATLGATDLAATAIVNNDPKGAIENLAAMTAGGMVLDAVFGAAGNVVSKVIGKAGTEEVGGTGVKGFLAPDRNTAVNNALKAFGFESDVLGSDLARKESILKTINDRPELSFDDNIKTSGNKYAEKVVKQTNEVGKELGEIRTKLDSIPDSDLVSHNNKPVEQVIEESKINTKSILNRLQEIAGEDLVNEDKVGQLMKKIAEGFEPGTEMSFDKTAQLISKLGKETTSAFKSGNDSFGHTLGQMKKTLSEELDRAALVRAEASGNAGLMTKYDAAMKDYSVLKQVDIEGLRSGTTNIGSLFAQQHGGAGGIIHGLTHLAGAGLGAAAGAAIGNNDDTWKNAAVGAAVGAGIGGGFGRLAAPVGGKFMRSWLERSGTKRIAASLLNPSSAIVAGAEKRQSLLAAIPGFVKLLAEKSISSSNLSERLGMSERKDSMNNALGDAATGLSNQKKAQLIAAAINNTVNNPEYFKQQKDDLMDAFGQYPTLQQAGNDHIDTALAALKASLPPTQELAKPFSAAVDKEFTPQQIDKMNTTLHYIQHPQAILQDLHNNTLSAEKVALATAINPSIVSAIRSEMINQGYSSNIDLTYQQKLQMGLFLGMQVAEGLNNVQNFQQSWINSNIAASNNQPQAKGQGHRGNKITPTSGATTFHGANSLT